MILNALRSGVRTGRNSIMKYSCTLRVLESAALTCKIDFFIPDQKMYESCGFKEIKRSYSDSNSKFRTIEYELVFDKEWDVWKESQHGVYK